MIEDHIEFVLLLMGVVYAILLLLIDVRAAGYAAKQVEKEEEQRISEDRWLLRQNDTMRESLNHMRMKQRRHLWELSLYINQMREEMGLAPFVIEPPYADGCDTTSKQEQTKQKTILATFEASMQREADEEKVLRSDDV